MLLKRKSVGGKKWTEWKGERGGRVETVEGFWYGGGARVADWPVGRNYEYRQNFHNIRSAC